MGYHSRGLISRPPRRLPITDLFSNGKVRWMVFSSEVINAHSADEPPIRVMALHALLYCERLFYLEEVEEIRLADERVYAGRKLHEELAPQEDESPERRSVEVVSAAWGLFGKVDAVRRRDGRWVAYEHKRGRC